MEWDVTIETSRKHLERVMVSYNMQMQNYCNREAQSSANSITQLKQEKQASEAQGGINIIGRIKIIIERPPWEKAREKNGGG